MMLRKGKLLIWASGAAIIIAWLVLSEPKGEMPPDSAEIERKSPAYIPPTVDIEKRLTACLRNEARKGDYDGTSNRQAAEAAQRLMLKCPNLSLDYIDACKRDGREEKNCSVEIMLMAGEAAQQFKH